MALYFFHVRYAGEGPIPDEQGTDHPDFESAKDEALDGGRDILANAIRRGDEIPDIVIDIVDKAGTVLETIRVRDLLIQRDHLPP